VRRFDRNWQLSSITLLVTHADGGARINVARNSGFHPAEQKPRSGFTVRTNGTDSQGGRSARLAYGIPTIEVC
jgi:hypothetical protein